MGAGFGQDCLRLLVGQFCDDRISDRHENFPLCDGECILLRGGKRGHFGSNGIVRTSKEKREEPIMCGLIAYFREVSDPIWETVAEAELEQAMSCIRIVECWINRGCSKMVGVLQYT